VTTCPLLSSRGALHIDRIMRDCADRRLDVETTRIRLMVAADAAVVLDGAA
jgi:hypothetical protein